MNFFDRLQTLRESRPHPCILTVRSENGDYCPYHANAKNSYMLIGHNMAEDCYYGFWVGFSQDCVDNAFIEKCVLCYECVDCREDYNCNFCRDCLNCTDCEWCYDCKGCHDCFGCVNLRNKEFHIFNKPFSRDEYFSKIKDLRKNCSCMENPPQEFIVLQNTLPRNSMQGFQNENVFGEHIFHCRNVFFSFDVNEVEDSAYLYNAYHLKDCMDSCYTSMSELNYMCHSAVSLFGCNFCNICWFSQNLEYCEYVFNSHDCFGCVSRNHAEYEILNQKYSKDEYFKRLAEIKDGLKQENAYGNWWWPSPHEEIKPFSSYMA